MRKRFWLIPAIWIILFVFWTLPALAEMIVDTAWVRIYGSGGTDEITIDSLGNIYVTGYTWEGSTKYSCTTIKYYPNGDTAWVRKYEDGGEPSGIAIDCNGNVYVTTESSSAANWDYGTLKYDSSGNLLWIANYNGPGNWYDLPCDIKVDDSGYVYITGSSKGIGTGGNDFSTIKYYPNGDTAWVRRYDGQRNNNDQPFALAIDNLGNCYVTGYSVRDTFGYQDITTIKYYPNGDTAWIRKYPGSANSSGQGNAMSVHDPNSIYVTGYSSILNHPNLTTIKYDSSGNIVWCNRTGPGGYSNSDGLAIVVDDSGNVYSVGLCGVPYDYCTIKYYPNGDTAWVKIYNGQGDSNDVALATVLDDFGNVYVTGESEGPGGYDYATIRYDSNGYERWVERYEGEYGFDEGKAIAISSFGDVYVTGPSSGHYTVVKYFQNLRGDVNRDWVIDIGDVVYLINYLYKNGFAPNHMIVGNCNCDDVVDVGDVVFLINYLFKGGLAPDC